MGCQICSQATFLQMIGYNVLIDGFKKRKKSGQEYNLLMKGWENTNFSVLCYIVVLSF